jgi:dTDP-4-dehydrorhamnose 3,5-epimerase-like enzyme
MIPTLISGGNHKDERGILNFNNDFDMSSVKRMYLIENVDIYFKRRWQGHKIEQRWFSATTGKFKIEIIKIDDWENPSKKLEKINFEISSENAEVLHIPAGYINSIQAMIKSSKLLVMADYKLGTISDDYKYSTDYFIK